MYFFLSSSSALSSTQHPLIGIFVRFRIFGMDSIVIHGDELSDIRSIGVWQQYLPKLSLYSQLMMESSGFCIESMMIVNIPSNDIGTETDLRRAELT